MCLFNPKLIPNLNPNLNQSPNRSLTKLANTDKGLFTAQVIGFIFASWVGAI